jgi:hypothetical protein
VPALNIRHNKRFRPAKLFNLLPYLDCSLFYSGRDLFAHSDVIGNDMQSFNSKYYAFHVWLLTIIAAPLLQVLFIVFYQGITNFFEPFQAYFFLLVSGAIISAPSLAVYFLAYKVLRPAAITDLLLKLTLSVLAVTLFFTTKAMLDSIMKTNFYHPKNLAFIFSYSACIVFAGLYCKLPAKALPITERLSKSG